MASLPWVLATGSRDSGLSPEVRGSYTEQLWEPQGLPYLRQEGQEEEPGAQARDGKGLSLCSAPPSLGSRAAKVRMAWLGALQASLSSVHPWPVSSLWVPAQLWPPRALCCTYSRLVFIPCEDDILFLLSVSVFMCEELLACCARAHGELVPRD